MVEEGFYCRPRVWSTFVLTEGGNTMPEDKQSHQTDYPLITEEERADINRHFGHLRFPDHELSDWLAIIFGTTPEVVETSLREAEKH